MDFGQASLQGLMGLSALHSFTFVSKQVQEQEYLGLRRLIQPSWAQWSAGRMRGEVSSSVLKFSVVSGSHARGIKFYVSLRCVVSCKGAASSLVPSVSLSSSSSVSVVAPGGWSRVEMSHEFF